MVTYLFWVWVINRAYAANAYANEGPGGLISNQIMRSFFKPQLIESPVVV